MDGMSRPVRGPADPGGPARLLAGHMREAAAEGAAPATMRRPAGAALAAVGRAARARGRGRPGRGRGGARRPASPAAGHRPSGSGRARGTVPSHDLPVRPAAAGHQSWHQPAHKGRRSHTITPAAAHQPRADDRSRIAGPGPSSRSSVCSGARRCRPTRPTRSSTASAGTPARACTSTTSAGRAPSTDAAIGSFPRRGPSRSVRSPPAATGSSDSTLVRDLRGASPVAAGAGAGGSAHQSRGRRAQTEHRAGLCFIEIGLHVHPHPGAVGFGCSPAVSGVIPPSGGNGSGDSGGGTIMLGRGGRRRRRRHRALTTRRPRPGAHVTSNVVNNVYVLKVPPDTARSRRSPPRGRSATSDGRVLTSQQPQSSLGVRHGGG